MSEAPILDNETLGVLIEAVGEEAVRGIIALFLGECRELTAAMGGAATPRDIGRAAHSLKSSAGQLGAAMLDRFHQLRWIAPVRESRAVRVTLEGRRRLRQILGIES